MTCLLYNISFHITVMKKVLHFTSYNFTLNSKINYAFANTNRFCILILSDTKSRYATRNGRAGGIFYEAPAFRAHTNFK